MLLTTCFSQEYVSICIYEDKNQSFSKCVRMENENCLALHFLSLTLLGLKGFGQLYIARVQFYTVCSVKYFRKHRDYFLIQYPTSNVIVVHLLPSVGCIHHLIPLAIAQKRYNFYEILLVCLPSCLRTDISVRLGQKKKKYSIVHQ